MTIIMIIIIIIIIIIQKSVVTLLDSWVLRALDQNSNILMQKKFIVMPIKPEREREREDF